MEIVTGLAVEVIKHAFSPVKRQVCYFFNHESKVQNLKGQVEKLKDARDTLQHSVDAALRNGELISPDVNKWLTGVNKKITEGLEELKADEDKAKGKCFIGLCPNFLSRYHLSKKAEAEAEAVAELLSEGDKIMNKTISHLPDPQQIVSTFDTGFEAFESRRHILEGIMEALKDPNVQRIGVYGMSGLGKTMLVKAVAKKARDENLFDEVVFATISNSKMTDIIHIQAQIAEECRMELKEVTEFVRATRLRQRLKNGRRILIILDDIWKKIDLEAVGISFQEDQNVAADEMTSECFMQNLKVAAAARNKVLLTSRSQDTLCNQMGTEKNFGVGTILEEEAMTLFTKIVGNKVEEDGYKSIAIDVVKKCSGLPIALSVIANALKNMDLDVWKDALQKLKRSNPSDIDGMEDNVYSALELSFNYLRSKEAQEIFLLCSLWPQGSDISVSDLIKYSWGLDFLERVRTLNEARKRVHACVHKLKGCGLLLGNDTIGLVKLHDIVHAVSISIGLKHKQMFVVDDEDHMEELHEKGKLKTCSAISMPYSDIHKFPSVLECPQLKLLSILTKDPFLKLSDGFFKETNQLKVLNLTGMNFPSLPSSFIFLKHLQMLSLHQCKLGDIAIIGQLKKLEILSFLQSHIKQLPLELGQLSKLKFLDLSNCSRLNVIPKNLISSLCGLEELFMGNSFDEWGVESNASLMELKHLPHLIALEIFIPDAQMMPRNLFSEKLERFKIHIGDVWNESYINDKTYTTLKLKLNTNMYLDHGIQMLLKKSEDIYLYEVKGVENVIAKFVGTGISQLKNLYIENCSELQHVTDSRQGISYVVFPTLESLSLLNLINLENIHGGRLEAGSFNTLKVIKVNSCRKMRNLVSSPMARELHQLQEIEVSECENIIEIVENKEEDTNDELEFCSLRILKITDLPKLITFCCGRPKNSKSPQDYIGGKIELRLQSNLLFNNKDALPGLEELELGPINIQRIWDSTASFPSPNLTRLIIDCCSNLRNLFSFPMARSLQQLKRLEVRVCQSIKEIVATDYEMTDDEISFPNLEFLSLEQLPKLTRFCGNLIKLSSLRELSIIGCPVLMSFVYNIVTGETSSYGKAERKESNENLHSNMPPLFDERVALPKLERLAIIKIESLRRIWGDQLDLESFNNLNDFKVLECNGLLNIFPITMLGRLQRLSRLHIYGCNSVEEIFKCEEPNLSHGKQPTLKLEISRVTHFYLSRLPKLKRFFSKAIECPSLSRIFIYSCSGVELLFGSDYLSFQKAQEDEEEEGEEKRQQPLFWVNETTFPNLEELSLLWNKNMKEIWRAQRQLSSPCFPNLKVLKHDFSMVNNHIGRDRLLNCFWSFPSLKKLEVSRGSFKEIFQGEVLVSEMEFDLPSTQFSELKLSNLNELRCLWNHKFEPLELLFRELTTLEVYFCRKFKNLVPSSTAFPNLVTLDISSCNGLINLLTHSVAKSFVHLTKMRVVDCERIEGIIAEDKAMDVIIFTQLKNLEFNNLPSLQNFCLSTTPIEFPSLDELIMTGCPQLKIFCHGVLSTPKLKKVQLIKAKNEEMHRVIDSDVNNTIKQLYQEKVGFGGLHDLDFSKFPELVEVWNDSFPQHILDFQNLEKVKLCNWKSNSLRYLLTPSMALCFMSLRVMEMENCNMIEQVIAEACANEAKTYKIIFPQLRSISLKSCSNLTSFCSGSYAFECPILHSLDITNCPKMVTFSKEQVDEDISGSYRLGKGMIEAFFSNKVVLPQLENLVIINIQRLRRIWGEQLALDSFKNLNYFRVLECNGLLNIFPITMLRRLQRLSTLSIRRCNSVKEIFECEESNLCHGKQHAAKLEISSLASIYFNQLPKLKSFSGKTIGCPSLRTVVVNSCSGVELLFASDYLSIQKAQEDDEEEILQQPLFWVNETTFPNLEELSLLWNKNLKEIWRAQGQLSSQCFPNLKVLKHDFSGIDNHIERDHLLNCLWSFPSLKKLEVRFSSFKEIFQGEVQVGETELNLPNTQLSQLKLHGLNKLRCLWNEKSEPLAVTFQELMTLEVFSCRKLKNLVPSSKSFPNLVNLDVSCCDGMINLLTHSVADSFVHLTRMRVADCERIEGIIAEDESKDVIVFTQLKNLELNNLPCLQSFCLSTAPIEFPSLRELIMTGCPQLKIFCQGALSTPKLQKVQLIKTYDEDRHLVIDCDLNNTIRQLYQEKVGFLGLKNLDFSKFPELTEVWNSSFPQTILGFENLGNMKVCNCKSSSLRYLLTPSMALCLVSLQDMEIENCNMIEQVMADTGANEAKTYKTLLPQLRSISLKSCSNLTSFCLGSCVFEFQILHRLEILDCSKMVTFSKEHVDEEMSENYGLDKEIIEVFFGNKVSFPGLKILTLSLLNNLKSIWDNQIPEDSFGKLETLRVKYCEKLLSIFPSNTLRTFRRVEKITIEDCHSLQVLVELQGIKINEIHAMELKELHLIRLPKMKHLWGKNFQGILSLGNLRLIRALRCWNLKYMFPISVAKAGLAQLEEVDISYCGVEQFFGNGRGEEKVAWFEFPKLTKVRLLELPRLKSLYPQGNGTIFCPKLEILEAFHCSKLKIFGTNKLYDVQEKNVEAQLELQYQQKPLFSIEEVAFKLKELSLINGDIAMINTGKFPTSENFREITTLHILCYHDELVAFPFCFLERFPNLEKLVVRCGKFKQLFPCEGDINEENRVRTVLSRIRELQLNMLGELRHIQNQNIGHSFILKNLETLQVSRCDTLPSLAPSLATFPNLMKLDVWKCKEMENILAISTCQCLVGLKEIRISECYMVTEIVAKHGDEETCEITFSKLELLKLDCLPNLTSFCSGNFSFNFPSLEKVIVKRCPGLKIFSHRVLRTPELESIDDGDKGHWAGDLNSTIQQLYTEKVGYRGLEYMDFSQFPELADLWINLNPQEILDFKNLKSLEVCNYNSLRYLFTPSMTLGLVKLGALKVKNCASIEHVFTEEGFDGSALVKDVILLPLLESVSLESCPRITSFYLLGKEALECLSLNKITVIDCPKMITFASPFLSERKRDTTHEASKGRPLFGKDVDNSSTESFFTDKVVLPSLIHLKLSSVNIPKIWEDGKHSIMSSCVQAQHLTVLTVKSCGSLTYLFPSSMVKSCAQLETLDIQDCKQMTGVILGDIQRSQDHSEPSSSENHFEFPCLRELVIEYCPSLETFITNTLNGADETVTNALPLLDEKVSLPSLERLKLQSTGAKVVWHGQHQHPVAKSLVQLVITDCGMIREVMACAPTDVIRDGIVFYRLKHLELGCLPDLESFCSAERTLEFPSLKEVFVRVCPNMKTFSRGETSTPKLQRLQLKEGEDEELCERGLNTTIQKFFAKNGHL